MIEIKKIQVNEMKDIDSEIVAKCQNLIDFCTNNKKPIFILTTTQNQKHTPFFVTQIGPDCPNENFNNIMRGLDSFVRWSTGDKCFIYRP